MSTLKYPDELAASEQAVAALKDARKAMNVAVTALKRVPGRAGLVQRAKDVHGYIAIIEGTVQRSKDERTAH